MRIILSLLPLLTLAACADQDPFKRPDSWSLPPAGLGANDTNLRAMVANPADLTAGVNEEDTSVGALSTRPIDLLLAGRRARLPSVNASTIGAGSSAQGATGGGPSGGGAGGGTGSQ